MSTSNTLDLSNLSSEPAVHNVQVEITETEGPEEVIVAPSTEEVVVTVQSMLKSDVPATNVVTKTTEERLNTLIELLKSTFSQCEIDDDEFVWTNNMLKVREALNEL